MFNLVMISPGYFCLSLSSFLIVTGTGFGISQSSRLSSSVSAMRVLNTGSDVEEAVADALVSSSYPPPQSLCMDGK